MTLTITEQQRKQIIEELVSRGSDMFGDGQNEDYLRDGFPDHKGYNNFTDQELIDELIQNLP